MIDHKLKIPYQYATEYCSAQERSISQVKYKLSSFKLSNDELDMIIEELIKENFINEERYAIEFARGKFRNNNWGRIKIAYEMSGKGLKENNIQKGLDAIDEDDYIESLRQLIIKKQKSTKDKNKYLAQKKVATFALSKGFESELIWQIIKESKE